MFFKGNYLRVTKPRTVDGNRPRIGYDGRVETKEVHLPVSARKALLTRNEKLPQHLRMKIDPVESAPPVKRVANPVRAVMPEPELPNDVKERKKPGPKPKHAAN